MATPRKSFKTEKGTELPILNLKGKEYLQVAHRLVWFREEHPRGTIRTTMVAQGGEGKDEFAVFRAEIMIDTDKGPMLVSTAHKKETLGGFADYIEKCETGAVGRALALLGFGTQFAADELEEGNRLADAPLATVGETTGTGVPKPLYGAASTAEANAIAAQGTTGRRPSFRRNATATTTAQTANGSGDDI